MTDTKATKKRPDYLALAPIRRDGRPPLLARIGVGFNYRNGSIGVLYDGTPLSGHILLVGTDDEPPQAVNHSHPLAAPAFEVNMVREAGGETFWTEVGSAWRQDGYLSVFCQVIPANGKVVLTKPREQH